jgi:predicted nucleic acid-binding protein
MISTPGPTSLAGAVVVDANVAVALSAKEAGRHTNATAELRLYTARGYELYAPGVIIPETLYALCGKLQNGVLSITQHALAVADFNLFMQGALPPPAGDASLITRAHTISAGYGCSRSADSLYIALAEELGAMRPVVLLTFDSELPKQAARNAPTVSVHLLT